MYLGSNNDSENQEEKYDDNTSSSEASSESSDNKFVVGNVPKELVDSATPAVVPEHGPRNLRKKRSISGSLEELLAEKGNRDVFISNEIDDVYNMNNPIRNLAANDVYDTTVLPKEVTEVSAVSESEKDTKNEATTDKIEVVESVSTIPVNSKNDKTTEPDMSNEMETTTKTFKVYEVFPSNTEVTERNSPINSPTTTVQSMMTETTTDLKSETTSTMPTVPVSTDKPVTTSRPWNDPDIVTYPPLNQQGGFLNFLQRLVDFKFRLGLGILQTTVDALNRFRDDTMQKVTNASRTHNG